MNHNAYMVVSGYHPYRGSDWFLKLWCKNVSRAAGGGRIVVIGGLPIVLIPDGIDWFKLTGDLGNCGQLLRQEKPNYLPTCPSVWMAGMMLAYANGSDFIYLEQDALAFGGWIEALYSQLGPRQALFGKSPIHGTATSLFIVRHAFIPLFVRDYLFEGPENHTNRIAELKVGRMIARYPEDMGHYSFGFDTKRPIDTSLSEWYAQKFTREELTDLATKGLIDADALVEMPADVKLFSNRP